MSLFISIYVVVLASGNFVPDPTRALLLDFARGPQAYLNLAFLLPLIKQIFAAVKIFTKSRFMFVWKRNCCFNTLAHCCDWLVYMVGWLFSFTCWSQYVRRWPSGRIQSAARGICQWRPPYTNAVLVRQVFLGGRPKMEWHWALITLTIIVIIFIFRE